VCTAHRPSTRNPRVALSWVPEGKSNRGRSKERWRRFGVGERQKMGFSTWNEAVTVARERAD